MGGQGFTIGGRVHKAAIPVTSPAIPIIGVAAQPIHVFKPTATRHQRIDLRPRRIEFLACVGKTQLSFGLQY